MKTNLKRNSVKKTKLMAAFYDYIGECHIDNICAELENRKDEIDMTEVPETLDERVYQCIDKFNMRNARKRLAEKIRSIIPKAAVILLVLFVSLLTLTLSVDAFRTQVYNFISTDNDEYSSVRIRPGSSENEVKINWKEYYFPTYVPEGFYIDKIQENDRVKAVYFKNENNEQIKFFQAPNAADFNMDTEGGEKEELLINGMVAVLIKKDGKNILFWNNAEASFYLVSELEADKLVIIAESLEKK